MSGRVGLMLSVVHTRKHYNSVSTERCYDHRYPQVHDNDHQKAADVLLKC